MLSVPFYSQKEAGYNIDQYCTEASIQMLLDFYDLPVPSLKDISPDATMHFEEDRVIDFLQAHGLDCSRQRQVNQKQIHEQISSKNPIMVRIQMPGGGRHTVVVMGANKRYVYYHDPWYGEKQRRTWRRFMELWDPLGELAIFCKKKAEVHGHGPIEVQEQVQEVIAGLRGDGPFDVDLAGIIAGKPVTEMKDIWEAIAADLWDLVPFVGDITNVIRIFKSGGKPKATALQTIDTLLGVVPGLGIITDILPANTILFLTGSDGPLPIPEESPTGAKLFPSFTKEYFVSIDYRDPEFWAWARKAGITLDEWLSWTDDERRKAYFQYFIMTTAKEAFEEELGIPPVWKGDGQGDRVAVTHYSERRRKALEGMDFRFVSRFTDRAKAEAEAVWWSAAEILYYPKFKTYHLFARGVRIGQLRFGTFPVRSIIAEEGVITVTDTEGKEIKFKTIESFRGHIEDFGYRQVLVPDYDEPVQKKYIMRPLEAFEDGLVDGPFRARRKLPRTWWWRHIERWIRQFTKENPEWDWTEVAGTVKDMDWYRSYSTPTDFMLSTDLEEGHPSLSSWWGKKFEDMEEKAGTFELDQIREVLREIIELDKNEGMTDYLLAEEVLLFRLAASDVVPDRDWAIEFIIKFLGYEPRELVDMGIDLPEELLGIAPLEAAMPSRVPSPPGPPPPPLPPAMPAVTAETTAYLNLLHLNAVGPVAYRKPKGFTRKVYIIPIRDEATGDIYHIYQGTPASRTNLYKIMDVQNKIGRLMTVLVTREEAEKKAVLVLEVPEVEVILKAVKEIIKVEVPPVTINWKAVRPITNRFASWIKQAKQQLDRRNIISIFVHMESLRDWTKELKDMLAKAAPEFIGPIERKEAPIEVLIAPVDRDALWASFSAALVDAGLDPERHREEFNNSVVPGLDFEDNLFVVMDVARKILTEQRVIKKTRGRPTVKIIEITGTIPRFTWKIADLALSTAALHIGYIQDAVRDKSVVQLYDSVHTLQNVATKLLILLERVKEVKDFKDLRRRT